MKKKLLKIGSNSEGVILPRQLLKLLGIQHGVWLQVGMKDGVITLDRRVDENRPADKKCKD